MLKSTVPTPATLPVWVGGFALALIRKTSWSGRLKATRALQLRAISSSQRPLPGLNLTMRPVCGPLGVEPTGFGGRPPLAETTVSVMLVVRLPEWNTAA